MNKFGLSPKQHKILSDILEKYINSKQVVIIYGSRAKGNYQQGSDLDLVIKGSYEQDILGNLIDEINESDFPYLCDITYLNRIENQNLKDHIKRVGKVFYEKSQ